MISKPQSAAFASWITGWFNLLGQVAVTTGIRCAAESTAARLRLLHSFSPLASHVPTSSPPHAPSAPISSPARERRSGSMPLSCSPKVSGPFDFHGLVLTWCRHDQHLWGTLPQVPQQCLCVVARAWHDFARHRRPRRGAEAPERQIRLPDIHRRYWHGRRRLV